VNVERKALRFDIKEIGDEGTFNGYASTRKKDLHGDIVDKGAFNHTINMSGGRVPLLWFHDPTSPIGMTTMLQEDERGLYMEGTLDLDTAKGRDVLSGMRKGYIDRTSIGFRTVKDEWNSDADARVIKEVELLEISPVTRNFAANDGALITGVKSADLSSLAEEIRTLVAVLKATYPPNGSSDPVDPQRVEDSEPSLRALVDQLKSYTSMQEAN